MIEPQLTSHQKRYYPAIKWLLSDWMLDKENALTGRSWLMAYSFLEIAKEREGEEIRVWDHVPDSPRDQNFMEQMIKILWEEHYKDEYNIDITNHHLRLEKI